VIVWSIPWNWDDLILESPLRTIADRWAVSKTALLRHRARHGHLQAPAAQAVPAVATPVAAPHPLAACAAAILARCVPEVRVWFVDAAARLEWPLDRVVEAGLYGYVRHLDQCPPRTTGPEG
jgi:hypothetical protein